MFYREDWLSVKLAIVIKAHLVFKMVKFHSELILHWKHGERSWRWTSLKCSAVVKPQKSRIIDIKADLNFIHENDQRRKSECALIFS